MKHLFVPYSLALLAKEKGFDEPCLTCYTPNKEFIEDDYYSIRKPCMNRSNKPDYPAAPLYQQLVDWFREKHRLYVEVSWQTTDDEVNHKVTLWWMITKEDYNDKEGWPKESFGHQTYYGALTAALTKAFELI